MTPLLLSLILFTSYSIAFSITLFALSKSQVYGLMLISILVSSLYIFLFLTKRHFLYNTLEKYFTAGFISIITISIFFSVAAITVIVYYDYYDVEAPKLRNLIIETVNMDYCIWLNLAYYAGSALLSWSFMIQYYRVFWVNYVVELFQILKSNSQETTRTVLSCVKRVELTEEIKGNICALCLELFYDGSGEVSRLPCKHHFH